MENPEISGRIQMKRFIPVEIFRKKVIPFEVPKYLFPVLTETTEIFCTICLDYQCQASCREKVKIFSVFCKWCNSESRSCFRCPKKYSTIWRKFFTEISVQMVSTQGHRQPRLHPCLKWPIAIEIHPSGKLCMRDKKYSVTDGGKYFLCTVNPRSCPPPCWRQRGRDGLSIRWPDVSHILTTRKICSR